VERHAPGECLRGLAEQVGGRAAQHEEPGRRPRPVREDAQEREHVREPVDLVEDDESAKRAQLQSGVGQTGEIGRVLQIEPSGRAAARRYELPGESGLSDLPGAQQRDYRELAQQQVDAAQVVFSRNLHALKYERWPFGFQCLPVRDPRHRLPGPPHGRSRRFSSPGPDGFGSVAGRKRSYRRQPGTTHRPVHGAPPMEARDRAMRFFNTAGPVKPADHYCIPPLARFDLDVADTRVTAGFDPEPGSISGRLRAPSIRTPDSPDPRPDSRPGKRSSRVPR